MVATTHDLLLFLTTDYRYAPLLNMSRQKLVGLRNRLYYNKLPESQKELMLSRLMERIEKLKNPSSQRPISTGSVSTRNRNGEVRSLPVPVYLDVPDIRLIRKSLVLPAVVRDHHGKFFQETTMIRMFYREHMFDDLHLEHVIAMMQTGAMPSEKIVREMIRRKNWTMFAERYELPSLWQVVTEDEPEL